MYTVWPISGPCWARDTVWCRKLNYDKTYWPPVRPLSDDGVSVHLCASLIVLQVLWDWCPVLRRIDSLSAWHGPLPPNLSLGSRWRLRFLLHIDWFTERACGCGRAAHSTTSLIHSLDNNANKTVITCIMVKKGQVKRIKQMYTNTQQTWSGELVSWVV